MSADEKGPEEPLGSAEGRREYPKARGSLSKLPFELEPEELAQPGVQKMLVGEISRLEAEVAEYKSYTERFHQSDKKCTELQARSKHEATLEILYTVSIAVGSGLVGWLPSSDSLRGQIAVAIMATALFGFAILAKWKGHSS